MTSLSTLPAFLAYFAGSLVLLGIFLWLHEILLPGQEWQLIRDGNPAAALSVAGALARGDMAEATIIAAFSLIAGVLNAACMS